MTVKSTEALIGAAILLHLAPAPAVAQGLAGFTADPKATEHHLTLDGSLSGGYDQNVLVETIGVADPRYEKRGSHLGGNTGLSYSGRSNRIEGNVAGGTSFRFYRAADQFIVASHSGSGSLALKLSRRARLSMSALANFSPYYQLKISEDPVVVGRVRFDYGIAPQHLGTYQAQAGLNYQTGKWSSLDLNYGTSRTSFLGHELDVAATTAGASYVHRVSPHASLRLGYSMQQGRFGSDDTSAKIVRAHSIDAGLDFARALTVNQRTLFDFGFGSSAINDGERTRYQPTGHAALSRRLSRTWAAKLEYRRDLSFVDGYRDAFFADTVAVGVLGRLSRRVTLQTQAGYISGMVGQTSARVDTYSAGTRLQLNLTRNLSGFIQPFFYRYRFIQGITPDGFADMNRVVLSAGVQTSLPLLRERNPSVTR